MVKLNEDLIKKLQGLPENGMGYQIVELLFCPHRTDYKNWVGVFMVNNCEIIPNLTGVVTEDIIDVRLR